MTNTKKVNNRIVEKGEVIAKIVGYIVLTLLTFFAVLPFIILISASFSSEASLTLYGYSFFPREFSLEAWKYVFLAKNDILKAYGMTFFVTIVGTSLSLFIISLTAYGLAQDRLPGRKFLIVFLLITMIFSGGLVASYIVWIQLMHIKNTVWSLIFPNLFMNAFSIIIVMGYFRTGVPQEILESARMDGANEFVVFVKMVVPLSTPILATIGLMQGLMYWNDWTNGIYYLTLDHSNLYTIQLLLNKMNMNIAYLLENPQIAIESGGNLPSESVRMAIALVGVVPILIAYPFFQKYFAKGLTLGGIK